MKRLLFVALALLACDSPTDLDDIAPPVRIDNRNYQLQPSGAGLHGEIPFAFTNPLADTIYLAGGAGGLYRRDGRSWVLALSFGDVVPPAVRIAPGATHAGSISVFAAYRTTSASPQFAFDSIDGEYRWEFADVFLSDPYDTPDARRLPRALRVSGSFSLEEVDIKETDCARHYSYYELALWERLSGYLWVPGMTAFDMEETRLCLRIGIVRNAVIPAVEASLRQRNIPRDAVRLLVEAQCCVFPVNGRKRSSDAASATKRELEV